MPITTSIRRQWSLTLKVKQWSLRHFPTKSFPPGLRGLQTPEGNSCLPGAPRVFCSAVRLRLSWLYMHLFIARSFPTALSGQSLVKNIGSLEADAKLISIMNSRVWKVLLDPCAGTEDGGAGPPQEVVSAEEQDWHKHRVWKRGFPARLRLPSPSAPEALFWAPWQEDSKWKGKNKQVCVFFIISKYLGLRDTNEKPLSCDLSGLLQEDRRKGKKNYENKHKRCHLVSFLSLFALYLKWEAKEDSGL